MLIAYGIIYSIVRFSIEFIRDDPRGDLFGLTTMTGLSTSQLVSLIVAAASIIFMIMRLRGCIRRRLAVAALSTDCSDTYRRRTASQHETHTTNFTHRHDAGKRLDAYLAEKIDGWSRSRLQRLIEDEDVLVNETPAKAVVQAPRRRRDRGRSGRGPAARFEPEDIPLDIVYEDEYLAVINKPAGMVVHPGAGVQSGTLANAIAFHFQTSMQTDQQIRRPENQTESASSIASTKTPPA